MQIVDKLNVWMKECDRIELRTALDVSPMDGFQVHGDRDGTRKLEKAVDLGDGNVLLKYSIKRMPRSGDSKYEMIVNGGSTAFLCHVNDKK